ncbi:MAG: aldehyde dehydrogenase family protein, partial [Microbacteriaceae bacterium]|nr:aldehyde dehydrogenase family protein [Microbacteriaceae bacterium]
LEEGASPDNFMSAVFELSDNEALFDREKRRFLASLAELDDEVPLPTRRQDRRRPAGAESDVTGFENTPDTDPSLPGNRTWGREILSRVRGSELGNEAIATAQVGSEDELDQIIVSAATAGAGWGALSGAERAAILHRAGLALGGNRARLMEVMADEAGKTLDQSDPEVSEAIDFAHYYAERARELDSVDGAAFVPARVTVVTPPWNFPVAIPAGSTLAALAAGSAVVIKPASQARRCGAVMVEALWEAGVPREVLRLVQLSDRSLGQQLIAHPSVDRVILTGGYETAELFTSFRRDLPLLAETSGKNAIIVTPSADLDLAVKDIVYSAFGHAGQKCSAASLVILVGSVATSRRFRDQLTDAVTSLQVGPASDPTTQMGPVIEPAAGKLLDGLTNLESGETWLVEPRKLDSSGRLWSPGVRGGVARGSHFHRTEFFGPILGVMTAATLEEAIDIQNEVDYGLTTGLHSLDPREIALWLEHIQAGNLYVNRGTTGAIVRRQPFGGWKKSVVGPGTKAGGPNYLLGLGSWRSEPSTSVAPISNPTVEALLASAATQLSASEVASLGRAASSDSSAWATEFGMQRDVTGLAAERNIFRYLPTTVEVRLSAGGSMAALVRTLMAAAVTGSVAQVSSATAVPAGVHAAASTMTFIVETDDEWLTRIATLPSGRVRLLDGDSSRLSFAINGNPGIAVYANEVTESGRIDLLPFLKEQAISITAHRFGTPNHLTDVLI